MPPRDPATPVQGQRRPRADAEANFDRILQAAESVFAQHGIDVSIELVAKRAGVGLGTVYRHFDNKQALIAELVNRLLADVVSVAQRHLNDADGTGLFGYLFDVGELLATNRGAVARLWSDPSSTTLVRASRQLQQQLVDNAKAHGQVRADLVGEDVAVALWSIHGILDVTRGLPVDAWRRHLQLLVEGMQHESETMTAPALTPSQMTQVIKHSPFGRISNGVRPSA